MGGVKPPVAQYVTDLAAEKGLNLDWEAVQECRDRHEAALRSKTAETFVDHEARYELFMHSMLKELFKESAHKRIDELYQRVRHYELKIENAMLVPRAGFSDWLKELHAQGKRVLAISDMYLSAVEIEELNEMENIPNPQNRVFSFSNKPLRGTRTLIIEKMSVAFGLEQKQIDNIWQQYRRFERKYKEG